jgi:hypothetical protein
MFIQKNLIQIIKAACLLAVVVALPAQATTLADNYVGANDHGWGDVIGSTSNFDINSMDVSVSGSILTVSINTNFAGKGDDGIFTSLSGGMGIGYGDLFLSSTWAPVGSQPYTTDQASNGTVWSYGFALDNRWMNESLAGTGTLYSLNSGSNATDTLYSEDFLSGGTFRDGQEVAVDTVNGNVTAINNGSWSINTGTNTVNFTLDLTGTGLLAGSDIAVRWGITCANDVIEGSVSTVPVPAAVWLFASGLLGLIAVARSKIS